MRVKVVAIAAVFVALAANMQSALAGGCSANAGLSSNDGFVAGQCATQSHSSSGSSSAPVSQGESPYKKYEWRTVCSPPNGALETEDCLAAQVCPDPAERLWSLWGYPVAGAPVQLRQMCHGGRPPAYVPPRVTP